VQVKQEAMTFKMARGKNGWVSGVGWCWLVFGSTRRSTLRVENLSRTILRENSTNLSHSIYQESRLGESCDKNQTQPDTQPYASGYESAQLQNKRGGAAAATKPRLPINRHSMIIAHLIRLRELSKSNKTIDFILAQYLRA
jgi:hypothetical protein